MFSSNFSSDPLASHFTIMLRYFLIIYFVFVHLGIGSCEECDHSQRKLSAEAALREKLFCNYNKYIRPVKYYSNQTLVQVELYPIKIYMDEFEERITVHGNIQYVWFDVFMQWDPKEFEDIKVISILSEEIWMPNIAIDVPLDGRGLSAHGDECVISHEGKVFCFPSTTINAYCAPDLLRYPFDTQNCSLIFLAPSYWGNQLNLNIFDKGVKMSLYRPNKVWEIVNMSLKREAVRAGTDDNTTFYPYLKCNIIIQRHSAGHRAIIILPGLAIAGLTLLTFFMNDMHTSRVAIAALTFVCNLMYCLYFGYDLPSNGDQVPLVVLFFRDSLVISGLALSVTTLVHRLQKITQPPGNWLSGLMGKLEVSSLRTILFSRGSYSGDDDSAEIIQDTKKKPLIWSQLAAVVDRLFFLACLFVYLILFFFFLP